MNIIVELIGKSIIVSTIMSLQIYLFNILFLFPRNKKSNEERNKTKKVNLNINKRLIMLWFCTLTIIMVGCLKYFSTFSRSVLLESIVYCTISFIIIIMVNFKNVKRYKSFYKDLSVLIINILSIILYNAI